VRGREKRPLRTFGLAMPKGTIKGQWGGRERGGGNQVKIAKRHEMDKLLSTEPVRKKAEALGREMRNKILK